MNRIFALTLCVAAALVLAACASAPNGAGGGTEASTQIANPFVDYATLADAAKAAGFELTAPETVKGYEAKKLIQVMNDQMIQIIFFDAAENRLLVRKQAGDGDISGDYGTYPVNVTAAVGEYSVTLRGDGETVSTAIWTSGGYAYAVTADVPMSTDAMTDVIARVA